MNVMKMKPEDSISSQIQTSTERGPGEGVVICSQSNTIATYSHLATQQKKTYNPGHTGNPSTVGVDIQFWRSHLNEDFEVNEATNLWSRPDFVPQMHHISYIRKSLTIVYVHCMYLCLYLLGFSFKEMYVIGNVCMKMQLMFCGQKFFNTYI